MTRRTSSAAAVLVFVFTMAGTGMAFAGVHSADAGSADLESRFTSHGSDARLQRARALTQGTDALQYRYASWESNKTFEPSIAPLPRDSGMGRRIVYAVGSQRVWLVDNDDTIVDTYLVSGRANTPRPGTYKVFSKSMKAWSKTPGVSMRYMVRFMRARSGLAIGFHDIPRSSSGRLIQAYQDLGTPQSAGCIRQPEEKAAVLWDFAAVGTTVVVLR
jgi:lipoprotein-anchoring transpeptidase ErfK/SrfK